MTALPSRAPCGPRRDWLADLKLPEAKRALVDDCTRLIDDLGANTGRLGKEIRAAAKQDQRVAALKTIHGIGDLTAMTVVAEVDDLLRFASPRKLCALAGLTPTVRNSDNKVATATSQSKARCGSLGDDRGRPHRQDQPPFAAPFAKIAHRRAEGSPPSRSQGSF
jgi:hypothetical protein